MMSSLWILIFLMQPASQPTSQPSAPASQPAAPASQASATVKEDPCAKPGAHKPWKTLHCGAAFTVQDRITMDALMSDAKTYANKNVRVDGTISAVCRKKGCWMTLGGKDKLARARVTFKNYAFFVPLDAGGGTASIEGIVELKTMSEAERAHLAEDAGKKIDEIPQSEVRIMATAVEVSR